MATKKSTATKKTPAKKAPAKKKTTTTRSASTTRKRTVKKQPTTQSFKLSQETEPFMTFRVGRQTLYWTIFGAAVIALTLWVAVLQKNINDIYDQIDATNAEASIMTEKEIEAHKKNKEKRGTTDVVVPR